jgi:diadenosine tetraphosphatase ApaH/serine/threonine PP2A family protein phosphatase
MYDIIGDIHSCYEELIELIGELGYKIGVDRMSATHESRKLILVGDLLDRGWFPPLVFNFVRSLVKNEQALIVKGNHDDKLMRWAKGNNVTLSHGLDATTEKLKRAMVSTDEIIDFISTLPYYLSLDDGKLIVVHASWKESYINLDPYSKKIRPRCIFGVTTGKYIDGFPERIDWAANRKVDTPIVVHGHQYVEEVYSVNGVWNIDTGCVFGNKLTALRYPEMEIVQVKAKQTYDKR